MNPQEQRIAIAEVVGYRTRQTEKFGKLSTALVWPNDSEHCFDYGELAPETHRFCMELASITAGKDIVPQMTAVYRAVHTTAAQRAEAFLRTIGKWRDS